MSEWVSQFGQQYKGSQEESQRLPYIVSTNVTESTGNPKSNYIVKKVSLTGGEQVQVFGYFDFQVSAGGVMTTNGASFTEQATGKLRITYPGGTDFEFGSNQQARLRVTNAGQGSSAGVVARSTVTNLAVVGFAWPVESRFQTGGEHTFSLRTSGAGSVLGGQMTIVVS